MNGVVILVNNMGYARALSGIVDFDAADNDGVARTLHVSPTTLNRYLHSQLSPRLSQNRGLLAQRVSAGGPGRNEVRFC